ncbi:hypothetical protein BMF35_a0929 [Aurantiacibacter gangjinensis]|uniref:Uncharacterized protein n=2 Tax=Aurantiacibacter gangjinensis TaxID=502682 RepID=A0A0G9MM39_9SPHN|nr:hypothetical protein BMF35_a0929 [Aurantiacibacter gangjinensis]KLE31755.1 hypothetical protein AAW01_09625 [Aurantiacibacter gangjinensis]
MANRVKDPLLVVGKVLASTLKTLSALAGGIFLLLIPIAVLVSQGVITGFLDGPDRPIIVMHPVPGITLAFVLALFCTALFLFFGRLRALIGSVADGDPFTPENARRLTLMAWLALGVQVLATAVAMLREHLASLALDVPARGFFLDWGREDIVGMMMVIVLFILARVFKHGAAMREDLEGTV